MSVIYKYKYQEREECIVIPHIALLCYDEPNGKTIVYLDNSCDTDNDCGSGVCLNGKCAVNVGMVNCQYDINCEEGYDCYKCLSASAGI